MWTCKQQKHAIIVTVGTFTSRRDAYQRQTRGNVDCSQVVSHVVVAYLLSLSKMSAEKTMGFKMTPLGRCTHPSGASLAKMKTADDVAHKTFKQCLLRMHDEHNVIYTTNSKSIYGARTSLKKDSTVGIIDIVGKGLSTSSWPTAWRIVPPLYSYNPGLQNLNFQIVTPETFLKSPHPSLHLRVSKNRCCPSALTLGGLKDLFRALSIPLLQELVVQFLRNEGSA